MIRLRPLLVEDFPWAYQLACSDRALARFRFRGWTPNPERVGDVLFDSVHVQFVVEISGERVGLVSSYRFDPRNQTTRVAAAFAEDGNHAAVPGVVRLLQHLFDEFPLRHVYFEGLAPNLGLLTDTRLGSFVELQARLVDAEWHAGTWTDTLVIRLTRECFAEALREDYGLRRWRELPLGFTSTSSRRSVATTIESDHRVRAAVDQALVEVGLQIGDATDSTRLVDLGMDSLMLVETISMIEFSLGIDVYDSGVPELVTVGDLVRVASLSPLRPTH